jgi:hypothetical protein
MRSIAVLDPSLYSRPARDRTTPVSTSPGNPDIVTMALMPDFRMTRLFERKHHGRVRDLTWPRVRAQRTTGERSCPLAGEVRSMSRFLMPDGSLATPDPAAGVDGVMPR